jgi:hypothetical protein
METSRSFSQSNIITKCGKALNQFALSVFYCLVPEQLRSDVQVMTQQTTVLSLKSVRRLKRFNLMPLLLSLATDLAAKTVTKVKVFIQTRKVSGRLIAGIFLAGCLAPLSDIFYAFDFLKQFESWRVETSMPGWYYENYSYFFLSVGPYIGWIFGAIGTYFIFVPTATKQKYLMSASIFIPVIKILWLIQVTSDAEFHGLPHWAYWIYGVGVSVGLWFAAEYMIYLLNHKLLNALSTIWNITNNRKALPAEQVNEMYATTCTKLKELI